LSKPRRYRPVVLKDPIHQSTIYVFCSPPAEAWAQAKRVLPRRTHASFERDFTNHVPSLAGFVVRERSHIVIWIDALLTKSYMETLIHEAGHAGEIIMQRIGQEPTWGLETVRYIQDWVVREVRKAWRW